MTNKIEIHSSDFTVGQVQVHGENSALLNLLDIVSSAEKTPYAPAINTLLIEPVNVGVATLNSATQAGAWIVNKALGSDIKAPQINQFKHLSLERQTPGSANYYAQQFFEGASLILATVAAGTILGKAEHVLTEARALRLGIHEMETSTALSSVTRDFQKPLPKLLSTDLTTDLFNRPNYEFAARPLTAPFDKVSEVAAKSGIDLFAKPILTENAETVAAIFIKHANAPEWNALDRATSDALKEADAASYALPKFPEGIAVPYDREEFRALIVKHFGEDGLRAHEFSSATHARWSALRHLSSAPDRLPILQNAFDELCDKFSLPRVRVQFDKDLDACGSYWMGTNQISIKESFLAGDDHAQIFGIAAHELTHVEEAALLIGRIADKLKIETDASGAQITLLQKTFKSEVGVTLTDDFAASTLKARNGRSLSSNETERTEKLLQGILGDQDRKLAEARAEIERKMLYNFISYMRSNSAWEALSKFHGEHLSPESDAELVRADQHKRVFRLENPEIERLVKTLNVNETGIPVAWSYATEMAASKKLSSYLESKLQAVNKILAEDADGYYDAFHEQEAHGTTAAVESAVEKLLEK